MLISPSATRKIYYFETSSWDFLQRAGGLGSAVYTQLRRAISAGRFTIVVGAMVFEEILPLYAKNSERGPDRLKLIEQLADVAKTVILSPDLLNQHVIACLCGTDPPSPFSDRYANLALAHEALAENRSMIDELQAPNVERDRAFFDTLKTSRKTIRTELRKAEWPRLTFQQFRDAERDSFNSYINHMFGPGAPLPAEALRPFQGSRPLRMYRDGLLAMQYLHAYRNRAPRQSDMRDLHHAVAASVTDGLVTNDGHFEEWVQLVDLPDFQVYQVGAFLQSFE